MIRFLIVNRVDYIHVLVGEVPIPLRKINMTLYNYGRCHRTVLNKNATLMPCLVFIVFHFAVSQNDVTVRSFMRFLDCDVDMTLYAWLPSLKRI